MWFLWFSFKVKWCHWHWKWTNRCFDCALSEPNHIRLVSCCLCGYSSYAPILIWWLFLQLSSSPSINCTFQQEDTTVVKKFQHILCLCSSSKQRELENRYDASNLCMKLEFFISQKYTLLLIKLLVITLTYHNLIY